MAKHFTAHLRDGENYWVKLGDFSGLTPKLCYEEMHNIFGVETDLIKITISTTPKQGKGWVKFYVDENDLIQKTPIKRAVDVGWRAWRWLRENLSNKHFWVKAVDI